MTERTQMQLLISKEMLLQLDMKQVQMQFFHIKLKQHLLGNQELHLSPLSHSLPV
jgi:hypothetical protein